MVARDIFTYKTKSACHNNSAFGKYGPNVPRFKQTSKKSTIKFRIIKVQAFLNKLRIKKIPKSAKITISQKLKVQEQNGFHHLTGN